MLRNRLTAAALGLAMVLAVGCEESDSSSSRTRRDRDGDGISDTYDRKPSGDDRRGEGDDIVGRAPDRGGSDTVDRRGLREIPRDAVKVEEGVGDTLRYEADRDGRVYVYDEDDDRVVYSGNLYRGEDFLVDPDSDVLSVNGKRLGDVNLRAQHRYRVYFMRD
jgi:hypothetical protein